MKHTLVTTLASSLMLLSTSAVFAEDVVEIDMETDTPVLTMQDQDQLQVRDPLLAENGVVADQLQIRDPLLANEDAMQDQFQTRDPSLVNESAVQDQTQTRDRLRVNEGAVQSADRQMLQTRKQVRTQTRDMTNIERPEAAARPETVLRPERSAERPEMPSRNARGGGHR